MAFDLDSFVACTPLDLRVYIIPSCTCSVPMLLKSCDISHVEITASLLLAFANLHQDSGSFLSTAKFGPSRKIVSWAKGRKIIPAPRRARLHVCM